MDLMWRNIPDSLLFHLSGAENSKERVKKLMGGVGLLLFIAGIFLYVFFAPAPDFPSRKIFTIKQGETLEEISRKLKEEKFIRSDFLFRAFVFLKGDSRTLRAGDYFFEKPVSLLEIARNISNGGSGEATVRITVPEGFNIRDIGFLFENVGMFQAEELWEVAGFPGADYLVNSDFPAPKDFSQASELVSRKPKGVGLEGYLFPDTYFFFSDDSLEVIVSKMLKNLEDKITPEMRREISSQGKTFHEILTMASLLEKEAFDKEDMEIIAGVLWKRMEGGVPLQVDASLTYITGRTSAELTLDDLELDSRFNTYRYFGLPPGPIANPGLDALEAALYPTPSPYWFFLSDKEGNIHYARTFEEHKLNKERYLR